jgi:hypothetical protein
MQKDLFVRLSRIYAWLFPFTAALVLALRFGALVAYSVVAIDLVLLCGAVWVLAAKAAKTGTPQQRTVLTAGVLLIVIVGIISLIFPLGPPPRDPAGYLATRVEQEFRYTILMIAALVAFGGFTVLAGVLREAGDRIFSQLGLAAIILSTVLFVVSAPLVYVNVEMLQQKISLGKTPDWYNLTRIYFQPLLVLGGLLTYAATAAYAAALGWVGWFKKLSSRLLAGTSVAAAVLVSVSPLGGKIGAPGFILLIPALPYLMPYFIGVLLVTRAGRLAIGPETAGPETAEERTRRASA